MGVISKHSKAIAHLGKLAPHPHPGLAKAWNVPVRPPLGVYVVECAGPEVKSPTTLQLCDLG